jgi:hypothetical protein
MVSVKGRRLFYKYLTKNPAPEALVPDVIEDIEE